jgi:hypothetical protein
MIPQTIEFSPLLVGLLIDVSGSMTSSIQNQRGDSLNRLQSFQEALGDLAQKATTYLKDSTRDLIKIFAYGFGFGNPLSFILGGGGSSVRDLLRMPAEESSTVGITHLADRWQEYKSHVENLAIEMFGATPMLEAFETAEKRFQKEVNKNEYSGCLLFVLSDGDPTDASPDRVSDVASRMRDKGILVVSCYVTDYDITEPRHLYGSHQSDWPSGARLMFDCSSVLPEDSPFETYMREHSWKLAPNGKLFTQINQSEVLSEFLNLIISPLQSKPLPTGSEKRPKVFISYNHHDAKWLDRLKIHLRPLEREGMLDLWHDERIGAGDLWREEITRALESAVVAILLISADFLASDFINKNELPPLLDYAATKGIRVLSVIVSPSRFKHIEALARFQSINPPNKPLVSLSKAEQERVFVQLSEDVMKTINLIKKTG